MGTILINGTVTINSGNTLGLYSGADLQFGSGGLMAGTGQVYLQNLTTAGTGISVFPAGARITIASVTFAYPKTHNVIAPGTYEVGSFYFVTAGTTSSTVTFNGAYVFTGNMNLSMNPSTTGSVTVDNATYGATIIINGSINFNFGALSTGNITINDSGQAVNWDIKGTISKTGTGVGSVLWTKGTGTITLSGIAAQTINFFGRSVENVIVNKPTSGNITWTSGDTITAGGAWNMVNLTVPAGVVIDTNATGNYAVTLSGNFTQSSTSSKFLARSSTLTINGNGTFTADGTLDSTQYNSASVVLNGINTLTYNNNSATYAYGFR
jgi:hypothetical protein